MVHSFSSSLFSGWHILRRVQKYEPSRALVVLVPIFNRNYVKLDISAMSARERSHRWTRLWCLPQKNASIVYCRLELYAYWAVCVPTKHSWLTLCCNILLQFVMSAVLAGYSLVCQPVDYSTEPLAMRVSVFLSLFNFFLSVTGFVVSLVYSFVSLLT